MEAMNVVWEIQTPIDSSFSPTTGVENYVYFTVRALVPAAEEGAEPVELLSIDLGSVALLATELDHLPPPHRMANYLDHYDVGAFFRGLLENRAADLLYRDFRLIDVGPQTFLSYSLDLREGLSLTGTFPCTQEVLRRLYLEAVERVQEVVIDMRSPLEDGSK